MASCKLIFALIFATKLVIYVIPISAVRISPLTSIRVEPLVDIDTIPGWEWFGVTAFGVRVPRYLLLFLDDHQKYITIPPNPRGGVRQGTVTFGTPYGEIITKIELNSWLGLESAGERVHAIGYGPNHQNVTITF